MSFYFPRGYTSYVSLQQNDINLFFEFMDISVLAYFNSVKLVMLITLKIFERFLLLQADHLPLKNFQFG